MTSLENVAIGLPDDATNFFRLPDDFFLLQEQCRSELSKATRVIGLIKQEEDELAIDDILKKAEKLVTNTFYQGKTSSYGIAADWRIQTLTRIQGVP